MAHIEVNAFLNNFISSIEPFYKRPRVLEIGSYDVNGSVRSNFKDAQEYIGVDLIPGPSVDVVSKGHLYVSDHKFDIVLSVESFEHNSYWIETFANMISLTDDEGILIFTCATRGRPEHGTFRTDPYSSPGTSSSDDSYYMNLGIDDFKKNFDLDQRFKSHGFYVNNITRDLYFYGLRGSGKIEVKAITSFFSTAIDMSAVVRKQTAFQSYLKIKAFYLLLSPLYLLLSEKNYQNATYFVFKKIRNAIRSFDR